MTFHPFFSAMSSLRRDVERRAAEERLKNHPVVRANAAVLGRDIAAEVMADIRAGNADQPPRKSVRTVRTDYDREGIDGWDPQYDSGA